MSFGIPNFGTWATEATYASGYSAGLPTKVAPVGDLIYPGTGASAPEFNAILSLIAADITVTYTKALDKTGDTITGPIVVGPAGTLTGAAAGAIKSGVAGGIQLSGGATDFPTFSAARTISESFWLSPLIGYLGTGWLQDLAGTVASFEGPGTAVAQRFAFRPAHNGATIQSLAISTLIVGGHATVPGSFPTIQVFRGNLTASSVVQNLGAAQSFPATTNVGAYQGNTSLVFVPTASAIVDTSVWVYWIQVFDESGVNALAGNQYLGLTINYSVPDMTF